MRQQLCSVLALFAGREITREVATSIVAAMFPERAIDAAQFASEPYGELTFAAESMRTIYEELQQLHAAHFAETERARGGLALNPRVEYAFAAEKNGELLQLTARDAAGALIGNIRLYVYRDIHTNTLAAKEDVFYLAPAVRRGFNAKRFWAYAERCLQQLGVQEVNTDTKILYDEHGKVTRNVGKLNEYMGYEHVSNGYRKRLKGLSDV